MAKKGGDERAIRTVLELAFPGDEAPGQLSVGIVSLVELCQIAMPDPVKIRENLLAAGFIIGKQEQANQAGESLAFDKNVVSVPVRNLRHELYGATRHGLPVMILLTEGDTKDGGIVFCSSLFRGALEADAVKAASHVTKRQPITGSRVLNSQGHVLRRVFWDAEGEGGIRGFMVSGPIDVEATVTPRAFVAFNLVKR